MLQQKKIGQGRRKGFAIVLSALMLVWVIPMVGLVIDVGVMYSIKARLSAACDAAALSAARSLSTGMALLDQEAAARNRAETFFKANFPAGTLETSNRTVTVTLAETEAKVRTIRVSGSAAAPVYFMQMLGSNRTIVSAMGEAARRDVNVMMAIDRSGSLETSGSCDDVEEATKVFSNMFANGRDKVGFLTFGGSYRVDYQPTKYFKISPSVTEQLENLYPGGCQGWTGSAQGLTMAYKKLVEVAEPGALNVLVFFTDGRPNTISADWNVRTDSSGTGSTSRCWDWQGNVPAGNAAWNPVNQIYRGWVSSGGDGIREIGAPPLPISGEEAALVEIPVGYGGPAKAAGNDCFYRSSRPATDDIAYYPDRDMYQNRTNTGYKPVDLWGSGPYNGRIRQDVQLTRENAAINAVDDAAQRIRDKVDNPNVTVVVHAIGLGDVGAEQHELLKRIANATDSPIHTVNAPTGMYVYAPTAAQLMSAFQKIGGEVLRLSK